MTFFFFNKGDIHSYRGSTHQINLVKLFIYVSSMISVASNFTEFMETLMPGKLPVIKGC